MKKIAFSKLLSFIVMLSGLTVITGWIFDLEVLKSISPDWVTMKITTAICFFCSGIAIYSIAESRKMNSAYAQILLSATVLIILLFMGTLLFSLCLGVPLGIENLFVEDIRGTATGWIPGKPSVLTIIAFILISVTGILKMLLDTTFYYIGWVILIIGGVAVAGYLFNAPLLCYDIKGWSNPMAVHTAILFVLSGIALILQRETGN